jgi:hypothetical protein
MIKQVSDLWSKRLMRNPVESTRLFTTGLYGSLLFKILFLFPIANDMVSYYHYHATSVLKQIVVTPGILARQFPISFLIVAGILVVVLMIVKRTYYFNDLGFWVSINIMQLSEPVANGSDYVLNLMLLLSIPLTSQPPLPKWKEWQPVFYNFTVLLIQVHIAFIYLLSGFDKLMTRNWRNGEAIAYIADLDYFADPIISAIQSPVVNPLVAWLIIAFELLFPVLIWFKSFKAPVLIMGVVFHLGIMYFLNLPDFGLLMIICYAIFLTNKKS